MMTSATIKSSSGPALTIIAVDMVALYGLCVYGNRANVAA
jgi:hypothetical protein